uniref:Reverse transcriptase zinc-binding domain-containing protein n=1 Tax=Cacopsylla melanoneura TaxID=428564 RepID=A0A8D8TNZ9_9HEMI
MRFSRKMVLGPSKKISKELLTLNRGDIRTVIGMLTGHCHLRKHLNTIGVHRGSKRCRKCGEDDETASHIIFECPALSLLRLNTLGLPMEELDTIHSNPIKPLLRFARQSAVFKPEESD